MIKKLDALAAFADEAARTTLVQRLCDARQTTFSTDLLDAFCATFAIKNARTSFDYIERGDYQDDLDVEMTLDRLD